MVKKQVMNAKIDPIALDGLQIKEKIETFISIEAERYPDTKIPFVNKDNIFTKLPFSDFKISISEEIEDDKLLIQEISSGSYELIEETIVVEEEIAEPVVIEEIQEEKPKEEAEFSVIQEIYEYEDEGKKPKDRYRSKIKKVDTNAIVAKIIADAKEKNKGKKIISFRDINKELRPYMIKKMKGVNAIDKDAIASIEIYLNAVDKIDVITDSNTHPEANKPDLGEILEDLDK